MFGQRNRQLDHGLRSQLLGADVVQHIGFGGDGRRCQLQNGAGIQALERGKAFVGFGVVRLVHNQQRFMKRQPVGQAPAWLADKATEYPCFIVDSLFSRDHRIRQIAQHPQALLV